MTHVLVVEDDLTTAREIELALSDYGFSVTTVLNGRDGLLKALSEPFDLIVLDRMLPGGVDGLGVLTALRAAGIATPVLILSALSALDGGVRGLRFVEMRDPNGNFYAGSAGVAVLKALAPAMKRIGLHAQLWAAGADYPRLLAELVPLDVPPCGC